MPGHKAGRQSRSRFLTSPRQIQNLADRFEIQKFVRIFPDISRLEIEIQNLVTDLKSKNLSEKIEIHMHFLVFNLFTQAPSVVTNMRHELKCFAL